MADQKVNAEFLNSIKSLDIYKTLNPAIQAGERVGQNLGNDISYALSTGNVSDFVNAYSKGNEALGNCADALIGSLFSTRISVSTSSDYTKLSSADGTNPNPNANPANPTAPTSSNPAAASDAAIENDADAGKNPENVENAENEKNGKNIGSKDTAKSYNFSENMSGNEYLYYKEKIQFDKLSKELSEMEKEWYTNSECGESIVASDEQTALGQKVKEKRKEVDAQRIKMQKLLNKMQADADAKNEEMPYIMTEERDRQYPKDYDKINKIKDKHTKNTDKLYLKLSKTDNPRTKAEIQKRIDNANRKYESDMKKLSPEYSEMSFASSKYELVKLEEKKKELVTELSTASPSKREEIIKQIQDIQTEISKQKGSVSYLSGYYTKKYGE